MWRKRPSLEDLLAKEEMSPKIRINFRIGKKIQDGGQQKRQPSQFGQGIHRFNPVYRREWNGRCSQWAFFRAGPDTGHPGASLSEPRKYK